MSDRAVGETQTLDEIARDMATEAKRDGEMLAYIEETLDEHKAPKTDSAGRVLSPNGRLVDLLFELAGREQEPTQ